MKKLIVFTAGILLAATGFFLFGYLQDLQTHPKLQKFEDLVASHPDVVSTDSFVHKEFIISRINLKHRRYIEVRVPLDKSVDGSNGYWLMSATKIAPVAYTCDKQGHPERHRQYGIWIDEHSWAVSAFGEEYLTIAGLLSAHDEIVEFLGLLPPSPASANFLHYPYGTTSNIAESTDHLFIYQATQHQLANIARPRGCQDYLATLK